MKNNNERKPIIVTRYKSNFNTYKATLFLYLPGITETKTNRFVIAPKYQRPERDLGGQELLSTWGWVYLDTMALAGYRGLEIQAIEADTVAELKLAVIEAKDKLRKQLQEFLYPDDSYKEVALPPEQKRLLVLNDADCYLGLAYRHGDPTIHGENKYLGRITVYLPVQANREILDQRFVNKNVYLCRERLTPVWGHRNKDFRYSSYASFGTPELEDTIAEMEAGYTALCTLLKDMVRSLLKAVEILPLDEQEEVEVFKKAI